MKRLSILLLAVLLLLPLATACKKKDTKATVVDKGNMVITFDDSMLTIKEAQTYQAQIKEATGLLNVTIAKTFSENTTVIFGDIDCVPCHLANDELRSKDWVVGVFDGTFVVGARTADSLKKAIKYFIDEVLPRMDTKKNSLVMDAVDNHQELGTYKVSAMTLGGASFGRSVIVVPTDWSVSEYYTAISLQDTISQNTGYMIDIVYGEAPEDIATKIYIGKSLCSKANPSGTNDYEIVGNGTALEVVANSMYGYQAAQNALKQNVFVAKGGEINITDDSKWQANGNSFVKTSADKEGDVRIMVHNVYGHDAFYSGEGFSSMQRMKMAIELYEYFQPDILGLQEYHDSARRELQNRLLALGYTEVPISNNRPESVNSTPLFYKTDKYELLQYGYYWYCDIEYSNAAYESMRGSYSPTQVRGASEYSKGVTWGIFKDKATGKVFMAASTHMCYSSDGNLANAARAIQIAFVKEYLLEQANTWLAANKPDAEQGSMPVFVGGDMNTGATTNNFSLFGNAETPIYNASHSAMNREFANCNDISIGGQATQGSTHNYAHYNSTLGIYDSPQYNTNSYRSSIDFIFGASSARSNYVVQRSDIILDLFAHLISDHSPVFADITLR